MDTDKVKKLLQEFRREHDIIPLRRLETTKPSADLSDSDIAKVLYNPGIVIGKYAYTHKVIGKGQSYPFYLYCRPADKPDAKWEKVGMYETH